MDFVPSYRIQKKLDYICEQKELEFLRLVCALGSQGEKAWQKKTFQETGEMNPRKEASLDFMPWGISQMRPACKDPPAI